MDLFLQSIVFNIYSTFTSNLITEEGAAFIHISEVY